MAIPVGKKFEQDLSASIPEGVYYQRLKDPAQSFGGGNGNTRFSPKNPYDCFMYAYPNFYALELKSLVKASTFWRQSYAKSQARTTYSIKRHQVEGLLEASKHEGVIAGFIFNFRDTNSTYFAEIGKFVNLTNHMNKKSVNQMDISSVGILIPQHQLRVNWRYDIQSLIDKVGGTKGR